tara:strand:+ start:584 stop:1222 length:639 start_codon:yes stop_codon:yes gene_type:complete
MKNFRFLRSLCLAVLVVVSFTNCSSDNSDDNSDNNSDNSGKSELNFVLDDKIEYSSIHDKSINDYDDDPTTWKKKEITNTPNNEYKIDANFSIKKFVDNYYHIISLCIITPDKTLQVNKTYDISSNSLFGYMFPLIKDPSVCYTSVNLYWTNKTIAKVKITSFDGKTLKGEFNISNLSNSNGITNIGYCDGTKINERFFNITKGTFTAIPEE